MLLQLRDQKLVQSLSNNPTKLMLVTAVPTELPPNSSSTPEMTPVKFAPSP